MRIALYGAPGRIGSGIAGEAIHRGHVVTGISRTRHDTLPAGVLTWYGDAGDADGVARIAAGHDVVVSAIAPDPDDVGPHAFLAAIGALAENVGTRRLVVIGGSGALQVAPGLRQMDIAELSPEGRKQAEAQAAALAVLRAAGALLEWLYISPAASIGPGGRTGEYRVGHESPVGDWVSVEDFAVAVVDEIEAPRYRRTHINVAT